MKARERGGKMKTGLWIRDQKAHSLMRKQEREREREEEASFIEFIQ